MALSRPCQELPNQNKTVENKWVDLTPTSEFIFGTVTEHLVLTPDAQR